MLLFYKWPFPKLNCSKEKQSHLRAQKLYWRQVTNHKMYDYEITK